MFRSPADAYGLRLILCSVTEAWEQREGRGREFCASERLAGSVRGSVALPVGAVRVYDLAGRRVVRVMRRAVVHGWAGANSGRPRARARAPSRSRSSVRRAQPGADRCRPTAASLGRAAIAKSGGRPTQAVITAQARHILQREPVDRADESDVLDALSLIRAARDDIDQAEAALLLAARTEAADGKPLLTFRRIAAALDLESEQAAQGRYLRRVGRPNATAARLDEPS